MKYQPKTKEIEAIQLKKKFGSANKGDWLVVEGSKQYVLTDEEFRADFEEVPPTIKTEFYPWTTIRDRRWDYPQVTWTEINTFEKNPNYVDCDASETNDSNVVSLISKTYQRKIG